MGVPGAPPSSRFNFAQHVFARNAGLENQPTWFVADSPEMSNPPGWNSFPQSTRRRPSHATR